MYSGEHDDVSLCVCMCACVCRTRANIEHQYVRAAFAWTCDAAGGVLLGELLVHSSKRIFIKKCLWVRTISFRNTLKHTHTHSHPP